MREYQCIELFSVEEFLKRLQTFASEYGRSCLISVFLPLAWKPYVDTRGWLVRFSDEKKITVFVNQTVTRDDGTTSYNEVAYAVWRTLDGYTLTEHIVLPSLED